MTIQLTNTLHRRKETFKPEDEKNIRMYVCGPTVYDRAHLGNARAVVVYDVLYRLLCHEYGKEHVTYVRNITDVDDKINKAAKENGESIQQLTERVTGWFHEDMAALGCLPPTIEPKATEHITEIIHMIERLIERGFAYEVKEGAGKGHVLFDVHSAMAAGLEYGKLSGRKLEELQAGARVEVESYKLNPEDFVLWKPTPKDDDPSSVFESPWGAGRPGWHIECSAMSTKYLGENFDIHGGGADLKFPHHENEIAQSCCANKDSQFANYWVHNGFLTVEGEKMSKSLGNFTTVRQKMDELKYNDARAGEVIRYVLLSSHYTEPLDWNHKKEQDAEKFLEKFYRIKRDIIEVNENHLQDLEVVLPAKDFIEFLKDDLNISKAIAWLNERVKAVNSADSKDQKYHLALELWKTGQVIGLYQIIHSSVWFRMNVHWVVAYEEAKDLADARITAKKNKDFAEADRLRDEIKAKGYVVEDKRDGSYELRKL